MLFIRKVFFVPDMAIGWQSTIIAMCLLFGLNFLFMGLLGEYVGRMFLGSNCEPQYVVRDIIKGDMKESNSMCSVSEEVLCAKEG